MVSRALFALVFVGSATADDCWAPIMPSKDGCSLCSDSELRGGQCVRSDRWFGCSANIESCCKYPEVASLVNYDTCIHKSGGQDNSLCKKVVSKTEAHNNDYCFERCDALAKQGVDVQKDDGFNQECMYQHYETLNGRTKVDPICFEKWIYGYSEPNDNASYKPGLTTETPAMCQLLCQQDPECLNWIWASDLYNDSGNQDVKHRCDLKNKEMVSKAAEIKFTSNGPTNMDYKYCNSGLPYMCTGGGYRCLPCGSDDIPSCIWESDMHVSGWRHCVPSPICNKDATTLAPRPEVDTTTAPASDEAHTLSPHNISSDGTTPSEPNPTSSSAAESVSEESTKLPSPDAAPTKTKSAPVTEETAGASDKDGSSPSQGVSEKTQMSSTPSTHGQRGDVTPSGDGDVTPDDSADDECDKTTSDGSNTCHKKKHPCGSPCRCEGAACSACCLQHSGIEINIMERPKHMKFELDN